MIRSYQPGDRRACTVCFESNVPKYFTLAEVSDFKQWLQVIESIANVENNSGRLNEASDDRKIIRYYVVEHGERVVGCGGYAIDSHKQVATFTWGLIHSDFQQKGFGKALALYRIREIESVYPAFGIKLDTSQHTYTFFEKLGFRVEQVTNDFYAPGLHRYDMLRAGGL